MVSSEIAQVREHVASRDCWCNPYVLSAGEKILVDRPVVIVRTDQVGLGKMLMHFEPIALEDG